MTTKAKRPYQVAQGDIITNKSGKLEEVVGVRMLKRAFNLYEIKLKSGTKILIGGKHLVGVIMQEDSNE